MPYFLIMILIVIVLIFITRALTVLLHELGHAIPALILTKQKVAVYVGSYGNPDKCLRLNIGLLEIWLKYNPFLWRVGICIPSAKGISINKQILYTLTGPITSLLIASIACYLAFTYDLHGALELFVIIFLGSSIFDFFANLIPRSIPVVIHDGRSTFNDGHLLQTLIHFKRLPEDYEKALQLYYGQQYADAAQLSNNLLDGGFKDEHIYRLAISSYLQDKNYNAAKAPVDEFINYGKCSSDDFTNAGFIYFKLGLQQTAIAFYDKALELNAKSKVALNNKGYSLNLLNRYQEAIVCLDNSIQIDKDFHYAYNNRGLAKIKTGKVEEGLQDINYSIKLNSSNAYCYLNLGIYHLDKGEAEEALALFSKAKELDPSTYMLEELTHQVQSFLESRN
jgi:tetratricopeptide (TPR) repeat protein